MRDDESRESASLTIWRCQLQLNDVNVPFPMCSVEILRSCHPHRHLFKVAVQFNETVQNPNDLWSSMTIPPEKKAI